MTVYWSISHQLDEICTWFCALDYCQASNISCISAGNKIVNHSDVVGALPVGAAPTTFSFTTSHLVSMDWAKTSSARRVEKHLSFGNWCALY